MLQKALLPMIVDWTRVPNPWPGLAAGKRLKLMVPVLWCRLIIGLWMLLAAWLLVACGGHSSSEGDNTIQAAVPVIMSDATFAGKTSNTNLFGAVVTHASGVEAYFCDGQRDFWFRGAPGDSILELVDSAGTRLLLSIDQDVVIGRLVDGDTVTQFELPKVQGEVLFRAETFLGTQRILGGWIKLPDGEQRGVIRAGATSLPSSLTGDRFTCDNCVVFAGSLTPAAFTPTNAQRTVNLPAKFTVIGMGDSFMSGEGAPVIPGVHTDAGRSGQPETWSSGMPLGANLNISAASQTTLLNEARACHRGASGLGLAVADLQTLWPGVALVHQNFACSGAVVSDLISTSVSGQANCASTALSADQQRECHLLSDDVSTQSIRPQLTAVLDFLEAQRLSADAVVLSIGGNDLGFGKIIADCLSGNCAEKGSVARKALAEGLEALPGRYTNLANRFIAARLPAANVHITQHPNPLRNTATDICAGLDFSDILFQQISDEDGDFASGVTGIVNTEVGKTREAHGWKIISSHVGTEVGHGICTSQPWYNDNTRALATQGRDYWVDGNPLTLSAGLAHPNQRGQREAYKPAYQAALNDELLSRFTPRLPSRVKPVSFAVSNGRGVVTLQWDDINQFESKTVIRNSVGGALVTAGADVTRANVTLSALTGSLSVKACLTGPTDLCSTESAAINVEVKVPTHMPTITLSGGSTINQATPEIPVAWSDLAPTRLYSTLELDANGSISRSAVEAQRIVLPVGTLVTRFRVAACNTLGCGPATPWTTLQKPPLNLVPLCVPPQRPLLNGCR